MIPRPNQHEKIESAWGQAVADELNRVRAVRKPGHTLTLFEVTAAPTWDGDVEVWTAKGKRVITEGGTGGYSQATDDETDLWFVGSMPTLSDVTAGPLTDVSGQRVYAVQRGSRWEVVAWAPDGPSYAVAQEDWDTDPDLQGVVSCKRCAVDGTGETGDAFDVYLPCAPGQDPAVFDGQVIVWKRASDGLCVAEGYGDDAIGTVKGWVGAVANIREGWRLLNASGTVDARGRVLVGYDPGDDDYNSIGITGGTKALKNHRHQLDTPSGTVITVQSGAGATVISGSPVPWTSGTANLSGESGSVLDNRQPYVVIGQIERYK